MFKMTHAGDHHGKVICFAIGNRICITNRSAGLYERTNAGSMCNFHAIIKWEKRITGQYCAGKIGIELPRFIQSLAKGIYTACLSATFPDQLFIFYQSNGIAFKMFANQVGKEQVLFFCFSGISTARFFPFGNIAFIGLLRKDTIQQ